MLSYFIWMNTPAEMLCDYGATKKELAEAEGRKGIPFAFAFIITAFFAFVILLRGAFSLNLIVSLLCLVQLSICDIKYKVLQDEWILLLLCANLWRI